MSQLHKTPGEVDVYGTFRKHLGPRFSEAGLGIQFHSNQQPGIRFKVDVASEYREAIQKGLQDAMLLRFPDYSESISIWVTRVEAHEVNSSWMAFYQAARMVADQAYSLAQASVD